MQLEKLIKGCIKKNREAQEELYKLFKKKLFVICLKYCRSQTEAEDHLHDVFIEIFEKIGNYKGKGSFEGWMKRIAINKAIDKYKKETNFKLADYRLTGLSEEVYLADPLVISLETLMQLIQELPNQYRIIFNLYELDNYSHKEIAKMLNISEGTSKSNLHRAKKTLRDNILEQTPISITKQVGNGK